MTIPEPAPAPPTPPEAQFAIASWSRIRAAQRAGSEDELVVIHEALVLDAGEYVAKMIEIYARPDERWSPQ